MSSMYIKPEAITDLQERGMAMAYGSVLRMLIIHQQEIAEQVADARRRYKNQRAEQGIQIMNVMQQHIEMVRAELIPILKKYPEAMATGPAVEVVA